MASKSKRGKHLSRSQRKGKKVFSAPATQTPVTAQSTEPAPQTEPPAPTAARPKAPVAVAEASDVAAELRRIGIVAGAIVVILVILALTLA